MLASGHVTRTVLLQFLPAVGALASLKGKETHRTAHAFSFFAKRARVWPLTLRTSCSFDRPRVLGCIARKSSSKLSTRAERTNERQGERESKGSVNRVRPRPALLVAKPPFRVTFNIWTSPVAVPSLAHTPVA